MISSTYLSPASTQFLKDVVRRTLAERAARRAAAAAMDSAFDSGFSMVERLALAADKASAARFDESATFGASAYGDIS